MNIAPIDLARVDWPRVDRSTYLVHQQMTYAYPTPIDALNHRLVVFPPRHHGDQRRVTYRLDVSGVEHQELERRDAFGNVVVELVAPRVESRIKFEAWIVMERRGGERPHRVHGAWLTDRRLLDASPLAAPDESLRTAAAALACGPGGPRGVAERINEWVHAQMTYAPGSTDVTTTAAQALAQGAGVCQDYAHVMIALARLCGLPARYVSGHLVGEGAMHAWVEVLLPGTCGAGEGVAWPFDPTHCRGTSMSYLTVAVGRDFTDVSPTRGSFRAASPGRLSSRQTVSLTGVSYRG